MQVRMSRNKQEADKAAMTCKAHNGINTCRCYKAAMTGIHKVYGRPVEALYLH